MPVTFALTVVGSPLPPDGLDGLHRAAATWETLLQSPHATTLETLVLVTALPRAIAMASAVDTTVRPDGLYEQATVTEIISGADPNGSQFDLRIVVDPGRLAGHDAYAIFLHEFAHTLGFNGFGPDQAPYRTTWDALVLDTPEGPHFIGEYATAIHGAPVPLAGDRLHTLHPSLMHPVADFSQPLDLLVLAMLVDAGVPVYWPFTRDSMTPPDLTGATCIYTVE